MNMYSYVTRDLRFPKNMLETYCWGKDKDIENVK